MYLIAEISENWSPLAGLDDALCRSVPPRPQRAEGSQREASTFASAFLGRETWTHPLEGGDPLWKYLIVSDFAEESQYDRLIRMARGGAIPDGVVCAARTGCGFLGFRGRSWVGAPGNIHLSIHLSPMRPIARFETVFMALAAVSVVDAIDSVAELRGFAGIRWVNDVVIGGAKVGGVLAYTQSRGHTITSVVLGIGLNVETVPSVAPTAFVPAVTALCEHVGGGSNVRASIVLHELLTALARNYRLLLDRGYQPLMNRYRARSSVVGQRVSLSTDEPDQVPRIFASGRVEGVGDGLELFLSGQSEPVTRGRLISNADRPLGIAFGVPELAGGTESAGRR